MGFGGVGKNMIDLSFRHVPSRNLAGQEISDAEINSA